MTSSFSFTEIWDAIKKDEKCLIVKPPKDGKGKSITTGTLKWTRPHDPDTELDFCFTGPPCSTAFPIVSPDTQTVRYPKCQLRLVKECDLEPDAIGNLHPHSKERAEFTLFVRDIEARVLKIIKGSLTTFGFKENFDVNRLIMNSAVKIQSNPEYPCNMGCKLDVLEGAGALKENIEPEHIRLKIRDVPGNDLTITDLRPQDKFLPMFHSVYPYYNTRGEVGLQWKLYGLQLFERGPPRRDMDMNNGPWVVGLSNYIQNTNTDSAPAPPPTETAPVAPTPMEEVNNDESGENNNNKENIITGMDLGKLTEPKLKRNKTLIGVVDTKGI